MIPIYVLIGEEKVEILSEISPVTTEYSKELLDDTLLQALDYKYEYPDVNKQELAKKEQALADVHKYCLQESKRRVRGWKPKMKMVNGGRILNVYHEGM